MAKQHARVELYRDGAWTVERDPDDSTCAAIYTRNPISVVHGRGPEQADPTPSTATLTFKGHEYNPENPASALYGKIGLNTPIRISTGEQAPLEDNFNRTVSDSWSGGSFTWLLAGSSTNYDVNGSAGTITMTVDNTVFHATADTGSPDHRVRTTFSIDQDNITGAAAVVELRARYTNASNTYRLLVDYSTTEVVTAKIWKTVAGVTTEILAAVTVATLTAAATTSLTAELYVEGPLIFANVWRTADAEPIGWQLSVIDTSLTTGNNVELASWRVSGNTNSNLVSRFDVFEAVPGTIRFCGEVSDWRPRRAPGGDRWVEVEAGGLLRREDRGEAPTLSPWRRTITSAETIDDLLAYWPCEDAQDSVVAASALPGVLPMAADGSIEFAASGEETFRANMSGVGFGRAVQPGTGPLPNLGASPSGGRLTGRVPPGTSSPIEWTVAFTAQSNALQAGEDIVVARWTTPGGTYVRWEFYQKSSGLGTELLAYDAAGTAFSLASTVNDEVRLTEYRIDALQSGTSARVRLWVAGNLEDDNTYITTTLTYLDVAQLNPNNNAVTGTTGFWGGHFQAWDTADAPSLGYSNFNQVTQETDADAVKIYPWYGWLNERGADRLDRVCRERGLSFVLTGDRTDTGRMGPQPTETFVGLLTDVERTDAGLTYDAREQPAIRYRTREDLYNQTPVTLDVDAGGEVADPLEPSIGDLGARNDVTVERRDGSTYRAVQEAGPRNVQRPEDDPEGIGRYGAKLDVNPVTDIDLVGLGDWYLSRGTVKAVRYPQVTVKFGALASDGKTALAISVNRLGIGDRVDLANAEPTGVMQLVPGYAETIGPVVAEREITFNGTPANLYEVGVYNATDHKYDSAYSTTGASFVAGTDTSLSVAVEAGRSLWVTGSGSPQFPIDLNVAGCRLRVTAISGATSPQTATVNATVVNGINKTIPSGTPVRLWAPRRYGL